MNTVICLCDLLKSKKKIILLCFYVSIIIFSVLISYQLEYGSIPINELNNMKAIDPEIGLDFFYLLQDSGLILFIFLSSTILLPNLISSDFLSFKINSFENMIITRTSNYEYKKSSRRTNFLLTFLIILITHIVILMTIQLFCFDISFEMAEIYQTATRNTTLFSHSLLMSLIIYMILSAIGYGIFSNFIYSLQVFVKNIYLYRTLGLITALILYIGSAVLSRMIFNTGSSMILSTITYFVNIINILTPGIIKSPILANTPILFYIGTLSFYILITIYLFGIKDKREYEIN